MEKQINLDRELEQFLTKKGLKEQFLFNCEHHGLDDGYVPSNVSGIASGFVWSKTKEGNSFWHNLNCEFCDVKTKGPFTKEQFIKDTCDFLDAIDTICDDYEQHETQKKKILEYLKTGKSITKLEALKKFSIWNSGDVIFNLRKEGYNIETTMITNGKKRFASYKLIENEQN